MDTRDTCTVMVFERYYKTEVLDRGEYNISEKMTTISVNETQISTQQIIYF